jgi:hypothetical protein
MSAYCYSFKSKLNLKSINWQICVLKVHNESYFLKEVMPHSQIVANVPEEHGASMFTVEE